MTPESCGGPGNLRPRDRPKGAVTLDPRGGIEQPGQ
jgi:hypothetical protein